MDLSAAVEELAKLAAPSGFVPMGELERRFERAGDRRAAARALEARGIALALPVADDAHRCAEPPIVDLAAALAAIDDRPIAERWRAAFAGPEGVLGALFPVRALAGDVLRELDLVDVRAGLAALDVVPDLAAWRRVGDPVAGEVRLTEWSRASPEHRVGRPSVSTWVPLVLVPAVDADGRLGVEIEGRTIRIAADEAWRSLPRLALAWRRRIAARLRAPGEVDLAQILVPLAGPLWQVLAESAT